jgi:hypothetical protein
MRKFIHRLRRKKEEERRAILHALVFIFGVILVFAWIYSLSARLSNNTEFQSIESNIEPFVELGNEIGDDFNEFKN